jgi:hypothetical protein
MGAPWRVTLWRLERRVAFEHANTTSCGNAKAGFLK